MTMQDQVSATMRAEVSRRLGEEAVGRIEAAVQAEALNAAVESRHQLLAQIIRSGSLPHEQVQQVMADQIFAQWYAARYPQT